MTWNLFLDDERWPDAVKHKMPDDTTIARTVNEAITLINDRGIPEIISFDHDLGEHEPTAMKFMWWLVDGHIDQKFDLAPIKQIIIHSANPVGARNLQGLWDGFAEDQGLVPRAVLCPASL